jgi:hypothetical protein
MTDGEKTEFIAALIRRGWNLRESTIWAPSKGLWFDDSHFAQWSLKDFAEIFSRRAKRITDAKVIPDWEDTAKENRQASEAAEEVLKQTDTQQGGGTLRR